MSRTDKSEALMRRTMGLTGALAGGLISLPLMALFFLGSRLAGLPLIPFDVFDWLARALPGRLIIFTIETMVKAIRFLNLGATDATAKRIEAGLGVLFFIGVCAAVGALAALLVARRAARGRFALARDDALPIGAGAGFVVLLGVLVIETGLNGAAGWQALWWPALLLLAWGLVLGVSLRMALDALPAAAEGVPIDAPEGAIAAPAANPGPERAAPAVNRRAFLLRLAAGAAGLAAAAGGAAELLPAERGRGVTASGPEGAAGKAAGERAAGERAAALAPTAAATETAAMLSPVATPVGGAARDLIPPAPGTRPELTANADFYRIDINLIPPRIDEASWQVETLGLFDQPRNLTLTDLKAFPPVTQAITMGCISNPVAGDLIGTSRWTGARLVDVLQALRIRPEARELLIKAADGFYESVTQADMRDPRTLLVYAMNGERLSQEHGFPLRIYIPNRYGMKQPKWITSIEAIDHEGPGYWVDRGWSATAHPQIVSVIDKVAADMVTDGKAPIGGIAWAGDRGSRTVEVQVDDGPWTPARLRTPPLSGLTWVQWRYDWPVTPGRHTFRVRAADGQGTLQTADAADTYPAGATGYHSVTANF